MEMARNIDKTKLNHLHTHTHTHSTTIHCVGYWFCLIAAEGPMQRDLQIWMFLHPRRPCEGTLCDVLGICSGLKVMNQVTQANHIFSQEFRKK